MTTKLTEADIHYLISYASSQDISLISRIEDGYYEAFTSQQLAGIIRMFSRRFKLISDKVNTLKNQQGEANHASCAAAVWQNKKG